MILILRICSWEKNPLKTKIIFKMLIILDRLNTIKISIIMKEEVGFINDNTFQLGKIQWLSTINKQLYLPMSGNYDLLRLVFCIIISYSDSSAF